MRKGGREHTHGFEPEPQRLVSVWPGDRLDRLPCLPPTRSLAPPRARLPAPPVRLLLLQAQLAASEAVVSERQKQVIELHEELQQLNRIVRDAPSPSRSPHAGGPAPAAAAAGGPAPASPSGGRDRGGGGSAALGMTPAEAAGLVAEVSVLRQALRAKEELVASLDREAREREGLRAEAADRALEAARRVGGAEAAAMRAEGQLRDALERVRALERHVLAASGSGGGGGGGAQQGSAAGGGGAVAPEGDSAPGVARWGPPGAVSQAYTVTKGMSVCVCE